MMLNLMAVLYIFRFLLKRRRTTTKNTGTKKIAGIVAVTIPPITPVPTAFCAPEPAPELITSGITPRMNARDVIRIGRRRIRTASSVASISPLPSSPSGLWRIQRSILRSSPTGRWWSADPLGSKRRWLARGRWRLTAHRPHQGDDQHNRERNRPALIQRRQTQEDDNQRDGIQGRGRLPDSRS